jgi:CRP/FNR family transcriptional regulator, cyclic AMP receptor protein
VASLTHQIIAEFVGTSREVVTFQMNRLRRLGVIRYSRKYIDVHAEAMRETLRQPSLGIPHGAEVTQRASG